LLTVLIILFMHSPDRIKSKVYSSFISDTKKVLFEYEMTNESLGLVYYNIVAFESLPLRKITGQDTFRRTVKEIGASRSNIGL